MFYSILKKLNLCPIEELADARKTIESQCDILAQTNVKNKDLKELLEISHKQNASIRSKIEEYLSDISARDVEINNLREELAYRSNQLQGIKVSLDFYKNAETKGCLIIAPCKPGDTVYWISRNFSDNVKPYATKINENTGYGIIELVVISITKNNSGIIILMDAAKCTIDDIPLFHDYDFGRCLFTDINIAEVVFDDIINNTTPVEKESSEKANSESILSVSIDAEIDDVHVSTMFPQE